MSQTVVETPSTTAHIVTIPTHAYISDLDSEERAVPVLHMAPLSSAGYQQIPQSDRPRSDPEERLTALDNPKSESDSEQIRLDPAGQPSPRTWRTFLSSASQNSLSTSTPNNIQNADHEEIRYERCKVEDFEEGIPQYSKLLDSDKAFFVIRSYGPYAARVLVQRELQLNTLIKQLCKLDHEDAAEKTRKYRLCTTSFSEKGDLTQTKLLREIEIKLGEYYDFLLKYVKVKALGKPTRRDQRSILRWMSDHAPLVEEESDFMFYFDDLVSAKSKLESPNQSNTIEDMLESQLADRPKSHLTKFVRRLVIDETKNKTSDPHIVHYSFESLAALARNIQAFIAVAFLLIPFFLLFLVPMSRAAMAGTVLVFVFVFACSLAMLARPKPHEMLIGTAAYGAFLVTFLGSMNSGPAPGAQ